jgi:putative solute:sodium symporter small subunit
MADGERSWWRRTRLVAVSAVTAGTLLCLLTMLTAPALDGQSLLGIPLGLFAATLVVPLIVIAIIFWAAERQRRIDRAQGFES